MSNNNTSLLHQGSVCCHGAGSGGMGRKRLESYYSIHLTYSLLLFFKSHFCLPLSAGTLDFGERDGDGEGK